MTHQGSAGNVIAGLASFFIPGLGQLVQGRWVDAFIHVALCFFMWMVMLGWIMHLYSAYNAARWDPFRGF